jgi:hypothetical protein
MSARWYACLVPDTNRLPNQLLKEGETPQKLKSVKFSDWRACRRCLGALVSVRRRPSANFIMAITTVLLAFCPLSGPYPRGDRELRNGIYNEPNETARTV